MMRSMLRLALLLMMMGLSVMTFGCSELASKTAQREANDRWSSVRGQLKYELAAEKFAVGQLDDAFKYVRESIGLNPESCEAYVLLARIQLERGNTAMAVETLSEALTYGADNAETDYLNGVISERYQRFDDALMWYRSASNRDPLNAHYVAAMAETMVHLDRASDALALVRERWTDFEQNLALRALAGGIHMMLGQYEQSANAYQQAYLIAPDDTTLSFQFARALTLARRYEQALVVLTKAQTQVERTPVSVQLLVGQCRMALKQYAEAKVTFATIVDEQPDCVRGWVNLAQASLATDELMTARRAAMKAVQAEPENIDHAMLLGFVCYRQEDSIAAIESLQRVADTRPSDPVALCLIGRCHEDLDDSALAKQYYERALQADAKCQWAKELLARVDKADRIVPDIDTVETEIGLP